MTHWTQETGWPTPVTLGSVAPLGACPGLICCTPSACSFVVCGRNLASGATLRLPAEWKRLPAALPGALLANLRLPAEWKRLPAALPGAPLPAVLRACSPQRDMTPQTAPGTPVFRLCCEYQWVTAYANCASRRFQQPCHKGDWMLLRCEFRRFARWVSYQSGSRHKRNPRLIVARLQRALAAAWPMDQGLFMHPVWATARHFWRAPRRAGRCCCRC
jgi:hypothetical protein